ncbi:hypothetical protein TBK1r_00280 [Stieleria magnilauensis]|uniref:Uncharacterized protein n=1 Tax=Stieleria magnilauensis TaxID=2527963 RepID=A0ABX5XGH9_9BACT|nr:hypothetical protein TBK1r_00280 [Planctomycetes bacterium TBK1r]
MLKTGSNKNAKCLPRSYRFAHRENNCSRHSFFTFRLTSTEAHPRTFIQVMLTLFRSLTAPTIRWVRGGSRGRFDRHASPIDRYRNGSPVANHHSILPLPPPPAMEKVRIR